MQRAFIWLIVVAAASLAVAQDHDYTTSFPATENPICQNTGNGCIWVNGHETGVSWGNMQTTAGKAFGTMVNSDPPYNDNVAVLANPGWTWTQNQTAEGVAFIAATDSSSQEEVELHTNMTVTPNSISGYEFDYSILDGNYYLDIVRWNGPLDSFCYINTGATCSSPNPKAVPVTDGDTLMATNVNGRLTLYINGVAEMTAQDSTFTGGAPGMGTWNIGGTTADLAHYGFSSFTACDSTYTGPPCDGSSSVQPPVAPTNLAGTVTSVNQRRGRSGRGGGTSWQVALNWSQPTSPVPVISYNIWRSVSGGPWSIIGSSDNPEYTDASVSSGASYSYYVESVAEGGGASPPSNTWSVEIP